jgi:hypothetical protein
LRKALSCASSLYFPNPTKAFFLYIHPDKRQALGLLCQKAGDTPHPIVYLSKQLDPVFQGWPQCLPILPTASLLILEATKLTFHSPLHALSSHSLKDLLNHQAFLSLPLCRVQLLYAILLDPQISFTNSLS